MKEGYKFIFGDKNNKLDLTVWQAVLFGILIILAIVGLIPSAGFNPEGSVTETHYYGTPRSEPGRTVWRFDYETQEYTYKDEIDFHSDRTISRDSYSDRTVRGSRTIAPRDQQRRYRGSSIKERRHIERLRDYYQDQARDELMEELEMEIDYDF